MGTLCRKRTPLRWLQSNRRRAIHFKRRGRGRGHLRSALPMGLAAPVARLSLKIATLLLAAASD